MAGTPSPTGGGATQAPGTSGTTSAELWPGRARLAGALALVERTLEDVRSLAALDPAFEPPAERVSEASDVGADLRRWTQYRIALEKRLEEGFGYRRLELQREATRAPLASPLLALDRAQELLRAPEAGALLDGLLALDDLVPAGSAQPSDSGGDASHGSRADGPSGGGAPRSPEGTGPPDGSGERSAAGAPTGAPATAESSAVGGPALARLERVLAQAAEDAQAMGAAAADEHEALAFLARWICHTGARWSARSDQAPPYELGWRVARADPFAPGMKTTLGGLPVPASVPTMASAYQLFRALGGEPQTTLGWAPFDRAAGVHHRTYDGVSLDLGAGARAARAVLALLDDADFLRSLTEELARLPAHAPGMPGVEGDVLYERATEAGGIVVGGTGPNRYGRNAPAVIVDLGGDDVYDDARDLDGALQAPLSVILDLAGDDTYHASGVAGPGGGVFGVALLVDLSGNDRYVQGVAPGRVEHAPAVAGGAQGPWHVDLAPLFGGDDAPALDGGFAFGASFFGIGVLVDASGDDIYVGDKWCFGAALGRGVGLALDGGGRDVRIAGALSCGAGVCKGVGALVDRGDGDDVYQVWGVYRFLDAPEGDAGFLSYGLGAGAGWRVETRAPDAANQPTQGGGIGLLFEEGGDDLYASGNCSQGSGYGGGTGVLVDLAGNDRRCALRGDGTGRAAANDLAGAHAMGDAGHLGLGVLLDVAGDDRYVGSRQGGGYGWDAGLGVLADLAGDDHYGAESGATFAAGSAGAQGFGILFDGGGRDVLDASCTLLGDASEHRPDYRVPGGPFAFTILGGGEARTLAGQTLAPGTVRLGPVARRRGPLGPYLAGFGVLLATPAAGAAPR